MRDSEEIFIDQAMKAGAVESKDLITYGARQLRDVTDDALKALEGANVRPVIFVRGQALARICIDEEGRPIIETVHEHELRARIADISNGIRYTKKGEKIDCSPSREVVQNVLAQGAWPFPPLRGLIQGPALRPDGSIIEVPGYDRVTGVFYAPTEGFEMSPVPNAPTEGDIKNAKKLIEEALDGFPFTDNTSKANAIGLLLTPILRPAIAGHVPLALIDAPQAGNGKGLLAQVACVIATGKERAVMTAPVNEEEWGKKITSSLMAGPSIIIFDNIERHLDSPDLASVLTTDMWENRILGSTKNITLPVRATWIATGNNVQLQGDLPRRCYWIRIDAKSSRPWKRTGFKHPELIRWVTENRGALLGALLTIARAWFVAGKSEPKKITPIGSFEEWCKTIGGVIEKAEWSGFLENLEEMYEVTNQGEDQWFNFLSALREHFSDYSFTVKQIHGLTWETAVRKAMPDDVQYDDRKEGSFQKCLGNAFSKRDGRRYGTPGGEMVCITRIKKTSGAVSWRIVTELPEKVEIV